MSALAVGFVLFACLAQAIPLKNEPVVDIGDSVIRLRVVANSSKERDCEIKLAVRDALLKTHRSFSVPANRPKAQDLPCAPICF